MPGYPHFATSVLDFAGIQARVDAMAMLGVPYGEAVHRAPEMARTQAREVAARIRDQGGPSGLEDKELVAIIAYVQRLGIDIKGTAPMAQAPDSTKGAQ
jgi:cytochrome c oxidase cbb3-type subunit I/II